MINLQEICLKETSYYIKEYKSEPNSLQKFNQLIKSNKEWNEKNQEMENNFKQIQQISYLLQQYDLNLLKPSDFNQNEIILLNLNKLAEKEQIIKTIIQQNFENNIQLLQNEETKLQKSIDKITNQIVSGDLVFSQFNDISSQALIQALPNINQLLNFFTNKTNQLKEKDNELNSYVKLMNQEDKKLQKFKQLQNKYNDRKILWNNTELFYKKQKEWMENKFITINLDDLENQLRYFDQQNIQLKSRINNLSEDGFDPHLDFFQNEIKEFQILLPIIQALGNKDLLQKHINMIQQNVQMRLSWDHFTLKEVIEQGILLKKDIILDISQQSTGEQIINNQFNNIQKIWKDLCFIVQKVDEDSTTLKISGIDDIFQTLDDHLLIITGMLCNRYVEDVKESVSEWNLKLVMVQETLDEWIFYQKKYIYLENIFSAEDIFNQLPTETTKFMTNKKFWRELMLKAKQNPQVLELCNNKDLLARFQFNNNQLDIIMKSLDIYLNNKRLNFPRFFFLSNDELLIILSEIKNPFQIQNHLKKCFDNISKVTFEQDQDIFIQNMISVEPEFMPETVTFIQPIKINLNQKVENWLMNIQTMMQKTILQKSIETYDDFLQKQDYISWVKQDFPSQTIITVTYVNWQQSITKILKKQNDIKDKLKKILEKQNKEIFLLVDLVKQNLKLLLSQLVCTLLLLCVHLRNITEQFIQQDDFSIESFSWNKQLRFYINEDKSQVYIKQTHSCISLSYEYIGNTTRLVMTPLQERCFLTLTNALHLNFGGCPAGPAGTGKTETVKDLSKALQIKCLVFNCSDSIDFITIGRYLSGMAICGSWSCFDEFNRISIEVLSVIAQQISTILNGLKFGQNQIVFQSQEIQLNKKFGVFITINPTYAGRSELPDNLKCLFRQITMMVPSVALIAEIVLISDGNKYLKFNFQGFLKSRILGKNIVLLFQLTSQLLSKQIHYDFGLRALKSILQLSGKMRKDNDQNLSEEQILIKAIMNQTIPKLLENDIPIFIQILEDIFPQENLKIQKNDDLQKQIIQEIDNLGFENQETFLKKIFQLYDNICIRTGIMIVGTTGTGKTAIFDVLQQALSQLNKIQPDNLQYFDSEIFKLSSKSLSVDHLYGYTNKLTDIWNDGIIAKIIRQALEQITNQKKWIIMDGPVDTLWVESLNTVLDDNKILCLPNGQRIKLPSTVQIIFEVENLNNASHATVSRCGMIYMDKEQIGWKSIFTNWNVKFKTNYLKIDKQKIITSRTYCSNSFNVSYKRIQQMYGDTYFSVKKDCIQAIESCDINQIQSTFNIFESLFVYLLSQFNNLQQLDAQPLMEVEFYFNMMTIFSYIWGIGGSFYDDYEGNNSRVKFSEKMKVKFQSFFLSFPQDGEVYDYYIDFKSFKFKSFNEIIPQNQFYDNQSYFSILINTIETVKINYILQFIQPNRINTLITGSTGAGKSLVIKEFLTNMNQNKYFSKLVNFSSQTTAQNFQDAFKDKEQFVKLRKDLIGAPINKINVVFIDDINMPIPDQFGSQAPIELLRQILSHGGFYDLQKIQFTFLQDCNFIAACVPPKGGKNAISARLLRQFNVIWMPDLNNNTIQEIYQNIINKYLISQRQEQLIQTSSEIVKKTIDIFQNLKKEFLPTPSKCIYTFNTRDIGKVFQGILQISNFSQHDQQFLVEVWFHELICVMIDRLLSTNERTHAFKLAFINLKDSFLQFKLDPQIVVDQIFSDISQENKQYYKISNIQNLQNCLNEAQIKYNQQFRKMSLIFFNDAMIYIIKITRILNLEKGNALLIGLGGSGRTSLTNISAFLRDLNIFSIELSKDYNEQEWNDDMKRLLKQSGSKNMPTLLFLNDNNILQESFLDNINNILNIGEIPGLMNNEDIEEIYYLIRPIVKERGLLETKELMNQIFINNNKKNLHIVMSFSPVGNKLRNRCRNFPQLLINSTTLYFDKWSNDALNSVVQKELSQQDNLGLGHYRPILSRSMVEINQQIIDNLEKYYEETKKKIYITPSNFIQLFKTFIHIMKQQQNILPLNLRKYTLGIQTLIQTNQSVENLQKTIKDFQPILLKSKEDNQILLENLTISSKEAKVTQAQVQIETNQAEQKKVEVNTLKESCQKDYQEALPILNAAQSAVMNIDKSQLNIIKSYVNPPKLVVMVLDAICLLFGLEESWEISKRNLLGDMGFLNKLVDFDLKKAPETRFFKLREKYLANEEFKKENIVKQSEAAGSLFQWVIAIDIYQKVRKVVDPKEKKLNEAQAYLDKVDAMLSEKKKNLQAIQDNVQKLNDQLQDSKNKEIKLINQLEQAQQQLIRAERLVNGLQSENKRWNQQFDNIQEKMNNLVGNILLSSGFIVYLSSFNQKYRQMFIQNWKKMTIDYNIPFLKNFSIQNILSDDNQINEWQQFSLPKDNQSVENCIIINNCVKWPYIIDPQSQANIFLKKFFAQNNIQICKNTDADFSQKLEKSIKNGLPLLMENVEEWLDPLLTSLFLKDIYKRGLQTMLKIGEQEYIYHQDFKFYMTSRMSNPHLVPEITIKVTIIDFSVTLEGLIEQLLALVIINERNDLEVVRLQIIDQVYQQYRLFKIKNKYYKLKAIFQSQQVKLLIEFWQQLINKDDDRLIQTLDISKDIGQKINLRMEQSEQIAKNINDVRESYRDISIRGAALYFVISQLNIFSHMYQWSLENFINLFVKRLQQSKQSKNVPERCSIIIDDISYNVYNNIMQGLFNEHKLIFSFFMAFRIQVSQKKIPQYLQTFFLYDIDEKNNLISKDDSKPSFIDSKIWNSIQILAQQDQKFQQVMDSIEQEQEAWKEYLNIKIPAENFFNFQQSLQNFEKLCLLKLTHPDFILQGVKRFINEEFKNFLSMENNFDLDQCLQGSTPHSPLFIILSPGADPLSAIIQIAPRYVGIKKLKSLSLGSNQGPKAIQMIQQAKNHAEWILLENLHLDVSWIPVFERFLIEQQTINMHDDFRIWITSMPNEKISVNILQLSKKITKEAPPGIKVNLKRAYRDIIQDDVKNTNSDAFQKLLYNLIFFHCVIIERKKYGSIGWNKQYQWMDGDLLVSSIHLKLYADNMLEIPYLSLNYMISVINYGGKITDDNDDILIGTILRQFIQKEIFDDNYKGIYKQPKDFSSKKFQQFIDEMPEEDDTELFGLNMNAEFNFQQKQQKQKFNKRQFIQSIQSIYPLQDEDQVKLNNDQIVIKIINQIEIIVSQELYYKQNIKPDPIIQFRNHEIDLYNNLKNLIQVQINNLLKSINGIISMNVEIEKIYDSILNKKLPYQWQNISYISIKPLGDWIVDLGVRIEFFKSWMIRQKMNSYLFSSFFSPQSFLIAVKQQYSRDQKILYENVCFQTIIKPKNFVPDFLMHGAVLSGISIEGASLDDDNYLQEAQYKVFYQPIPYIEQNYLQRIKPILINNYSSQGYYQAPLYRTIQRAGDINSIGQQTNFILNLDLQTRENSDKWILRGVALFCQIEK